MRKMLTVAMFAMATFVAGLAQPQTDEALMQAQALEANNNNDFDKAIELMNLCLERFEPHTMNYAILARAQYNKGNYRDALLSTEKGLALAKRKDYENKGLLFKLRGDSFFALHEWSNAIENYNASLKANPDSKVSGLLARGAAFSKIGNFEEAKRLSPANIAPYLGLCYNLKKQKMYDAAIEQYSKALVRLNVNEDLLVGRAECYASQKKWVSAANDVISALERTSSADVNSVYNHFDNIGFDMMASKLKSQLKKGNNENNVWLLISLYEFYMYFDKYEEALSYVKRIHDVMHNPMSFIMLSELYAKTNRMHDALQCAQEAVQSDSSYVTAQIQYAQQVFHSGDTAKANKLFEAAMSNNPTNAYCAMDYARFLLETGNPQKAKTVLDPIISRGLPSDYEWNFYGRTLLALGLSDQANLAFSKSSGDKVDMTYCFSQFFMGHTNEALATADSILGNSPYHEYINNLYDGACIFSLANDTTRALDLLAKTFENGYINEGLVKTDLDLINLRKTQGYADLANKYFKTYSNGTDSKIEVVELPLTTENSNSNMLKCQVNGLPLKVAFHTQNTSASISTVEANFLLKNEYIAFSDVLNRNYIDSYGNLMDGAPIIIRNLSFGSLTLENVMVMVKQQQAPIMLGPSAFTPIGKCELDGAAHVLRIETKK